MEKKTCTKCGEEKELSDYYIKNKKTNRLFSQCKTCTNKKNIEWTKNNKEKVKELQKIYREKNKEKLNESSRIYREKNKDSYREQKNKNAKEYRKRNKEKVKESQKIYREKNRDKLIDYSKNYRLNNLEYFKKSDKDRYQRKKEEIIKNQKEYYKNNIEKIKEYREKNRERFKPRVRKYMNEYDKKRLKTDIVYHLRRNIKSSLSSYLKRGGYTKKSRTYQILGCPYEDFKTYIESKFETWMTWDNKGLYNGQLNYGWDLDHIIPLSSAGSEEELIKLSHYSNIQPLCSKINRDVKKNLLDWCPSNE
jgi:hypothetical protein